MAADAIHGNTGKLFCKASTVATFDDFVQLCKKANNNIKTIVLGLPIIYPISQKARRRSSTKVKIPLMESIVKVQFKKEAGCYITKNRSWKKAISLPIFSNLLS